MLVLHGREIPILLNYVPDSNAVVWVSRGQNTMSHIYEGLPRNTIGEAGSEIPGHAQGWLVPVMEESSQFPLRGRWGIGSCWFFFTGREKGWVKAKIHIQWALSKSDSRIYIASWHCWLQLQTTGLRVFVGLCCEDTFIFLCPSSFYAELYILERTNAATAGL